jgi:hypothetical protein
MVFPEGCICFPQNEPPCVQWCAEVEVAAAVLCPLHGRRFERAERPDPYRCMRVREADFRAGWPARSKQYQKAMQASFPLDHWPLTGERRESGGSTILILRDRTEVPGGGYAEEWHP